MKKYLVRAGFDPYRIYTPRDLLKRDFLGGNSGNLMFAYGVMNVLTTEDAECVPTLYKREWTEEEVEYINSTYDAFILPLADAFRQSFVPQLKAFTSLIKRLTIPCIVIGVGLRADYEPKLDERRPFDDVVKEFVSVVLDHSACLGLRGEITGQYLAKLGFVPERDFTPIGCPSLYMHGNALSLKQYDRKFDRLAINVNALATEEQSCFFSRIIDANDKAVIVQQRVAEILDLYYDRKVGLEASNGKNIFLSFDYDRIKRENRVKFFLDVPSWLSFMKDFDLFIGQRFHGTVAAILSGVPSVIVPFDARTRELAEYHCLASLSHKEIAVNPSLAEIIEECDFSMFYQNHGTTMKHYIDFLHVNNISSVFDNDQYFCLDSFPMEQKLAGAPHAVETYSSFFSVDSYTRIMRKTEYFYFRGMKKIQRILKR